MRSHLSAAGLWVATTAVATTIVWAGIGGIGDAARSERDLVTASPTVSGTGTSLAPTSAPPTTAPPTTAPPTTATPATTTPATTTAPPAATAGVTTPPATTMPATLLPSPFELRTFELTGGIVTVRFSAASVVVVLATPSPGYAAESTQRGPTAIRVEFEDGERRSRLEASWSGGPVHQIGEDD